MFMMGQIDLSSKYNNPRRIEMPLKSINQSTYIILTGYQSFTLAETNKKSP